MDTDVIARIYPLDSEEATREMKASIHCEVVPRPLTALPTTRAATSRQHAVVLRFSRPLLGGRGFVFGRDRKARRHAHGVIERRRSIYVMIKA